MKRHIILAAVMACLCVGLKAQEVKSQEPKGKAIIQVFGNFNTGFGAEGNKRGFELERSYLGYEYKLGNGLSIKSIVDVGKSSDVTDVNRIAYIKNAMITWKKGNMTLDGGVIPTTQFTFQQKFWGYRYVMSDFQDKYKFGSSADLGLSLAYKFADWISADAIVVNGEGYKKIQINDGLNYGVGVTLTPVEGFYIRLYGGVNEGADDTQKDKINLAAFAGYKREKFSIGAEYNKMENASYKQDADQSGYSIFTTVKVAKNTELFARFDDVYSKDDWNISKDDQSAILGVQFKLGKYVKLAPNFRMSNPKVAGADNKYYAYINFYFGL